MSQLFTITVDHEIVFEESLEDAKVIIAAAVDSLLGENKVYAGLPDGRGIEAETVGVKRVRRRKP